MIQLFIDFLDKAIYFFGLAPDFVIRIAFVILFLEIILVCFFFLNLLFIAIFKKNLNYLKKSNMTL
jgi:hypothetical protein